MDQRPDQTDRSRLKDVHQTDLTESRVNEDFVDWLKTAGPTWLLVGLLALCAYLAMVRFRQGRVAKVQTAWAELSTAQTPGALSDVVKDYGSVGSIGTIARLNAADTYLSSVQRGAELGTGLASSDPLVPPSPVVELTDAKRNEYLDGASALYREVLDADDGSNAKTIFVVNAMTGLAVVAECRADVDGARSWYEKAAARALEYYPGLAAQCRDRAAAAGELSGEPIKFPATVDLATVQGALPPRDPVELDASLRDLIMPDAESSG